MGNINHDDFNIQRNSLLDHLNPGEFERFHLILVRDGHHSLNEIHFLNTLLTRFELFGEAEMPLEQKEAERLYALIDRISVTAVA